MIPLFLVAFFLAVILALKLQGEEWKDTLTLAGISTVIFFVVLFPLGMLL